MRIRILLLVAALLSGPVNIRELIRPPFRIVGLHKRLE